MYLLIPLLLVLSAIGCSEPVGTVSGTVTLDGKPLPTGRVVFHPEERRFAPAFARLDVDGHYELKRAKGKRGAAPGKYRVSIQRAGKEGDPKFQVVARAFPIPEIYGNEESTPLVAEVLAGENTINFDIPKRRQ
jgi:hypothetical protein